ncbi:MAG: GAF domain-containing protein [Deltaproteobacteria bacterium]|nr:GAF domain-containing protein [Deltaproteobacteria bacterium]
MMERKADIETLFRIFRSVSKSVHTSTSVGEVLDLVVRGTAEALHAMGSILRILNLRTDEFELNAAYGLSEKYLTKGHVIRKTLYVGKIHEKGAIIISNVETDPRVQYPREAREEGIKMMLDLPLILADDVVGLIRVFFPETREFSREELEFAEAIAEECAYVIDKAMLIERQRVDYHQLAVKTEKLSSLGRLAAGIAHEINNPLAAILLYGTSMLKEVPPESPHKEGLEIIVHETVRCRGIIQELLEFSREKESRKVPVNVNKIIEKALTILENEFRLRRICVEKDLSDNLPEIPLDVNQMEQVFINFLVNAMEAIPGEGSVTIRTSEDEDGRGLVIEIEDNGIGISDEYKDRIFEPFFSSKPKGTGLGLPVNFGIVEKHQGRIDVFSELGQGTRMVVWLPCVEGGA